MLSSLGLLFCGLNPQREGCCPSYQLLGSSDPVPDFVRGVHYMISSEASLERFSQHKTLQMEKTPEPCQMILLHQTGLILTKIYNHCPHLLRIHPPPSKCLLFVVFVPDLEGLEDQMPFASYSRGSWHFHFH